MSLSFTLTADDPLLETDQRFYQELTENGVTIGMEVCFAVEKAPYYSPDLPEIAARVTQAYRYGLEFAENEDSLCRMRDYLRKTGRAGGAVEIWAIWLGGEISPFTPPRWEVSLEELELDMLRWLSREPCRPDSKTMAACLVIHL